MYFSVLYKHHTTSIFSKCFFHIKGFQMVQKVHPEHTPIFLHIFNFDFIVSLMRKLFEIQNSVIGLNIIRLPWFTPTHQGLSNGTKSCIRGCFGLGDVNITPSLVNVNNMGNKLNNIMY
jgi:hypothetical protein